MSRYSGLVRTASQALLTTAFAVGTVVGALAQDASPAANEATAADTATPAEQPRRNRDRRRNDAAVEAPAQAAAATATETTAAATVQQAETVEARMICKNIKITGTKISKRICGTTEQWAATNQKTSDDANEAMRQMRQQTGIVVTQPGTPGPGGFGAAN